MAGTHRTEHDRLSLYAQLGAAPHAFDFYQALRRLEAMHPASPRIGEALRPADEPVRLAQEPSLTFAPANLAGFATTPAGNVRLTVRFLGLFGPQGALPAHLTELARERLRHHGDPTLTRFADLFHHRLLSMFYKAWRQAQPAVCHDRPDSDRFAAYVEASFGGSGKALAGRDSIAAHAKRFFAGQLSQGVKNAEGLAAIVSTYFGIVVSVRQFHAQWMVLPPEQRSALAMGKNNRLGRSLVVGRRVWDAQHHFLLQLGPLTLEQYRSLLPGTPGSTRLRDWVRLYTGRQFGWRAQLSLRPDEVPALQLNRGRQIGWTTWLGPRRSAGTAGTESHAVSGLLLNPEQARP